MRKYNEIEEYVLKIKNKQDTTLQSDLYQISLDILQLWNEYKTLGNGKEKQDTLKLIDSYLTKYENVQQIYNKLEKAATTVPKQYFSPREFTHEEYLQKMDRTIIEEILERVHIHSGLREHDNEVHNIFLETLGWFFNEYDVITILRSYLLKNAKDVYLDEYALQYGLIRKTGESDDELRKRILAHLKELFRVKDVSESGVDLFTYVENPVTQLTSRNTYLSHKYLAHSDEALMDYWENRYITRGDLEWF